MECTVSFGGTSWARTATITGEADGWGSIILPFGTVSNVLRVHTVQDMIDNQYNPASTYHYDQYAWMRPGVHGPIFATYRTHIEVFTFPVDDSSSTVIDGSAVAIAGLLRHDIGVDAWPNPATDRLEVTFGMQGGRKVAVEVPDATGRVVCTSSRRTGVTGVQREVMDLHGLVSGVHLLRVTADDGSTGMKRFVKH